MRLFSCMRLASVVFISLALAALIFTLPVSRMTTKNKVDPSSTLQSNSNPYSYNSQEPGMRMDFINHVSDLLWSGTIDLENRGEETRTNVEQAAKAIDMTVVHPNELFSFNEVVGIRSEDKGYRSGLMFSNGQVITGVGGGICIVSTLLYNAALETGLKIIERYPHSGRVSYAEPGRDAAVVYGVEDLSFKNNTGSLMLVRAVVEDEKLIVSLYGTERPGRTVEIVAKDYQEVPYKIVETEDETVPEGQLVVDQKAKPGYSVTIVRLVKQDGKLVSREEISKDVMPPADKLMRVPPKPKTLMVQPSSPNPSMEMPNGEAAKTMQPKPKTGVILVPDAAPKGQDSESSLPLISPAVPGRNLSTSERTVSRARE